ncbi:MAG TPA: hypothetical protein VFU00_02255, partial [Gemmatimonadales bacterium]|nr:hypothetical protein [Gemmatimonadales bacterium]
AAAAIGIAIKPQFVLLWVVREGLVLWRTRRVTPEGVIVPVLGAAYLAAVALFAPEYFALVRELGPAYHTFIRNPLLVTALLGDGAALALGALVVAAALWKRLGARRPALGGSAPGDLALVLAASVAACYLAAVLQQKGWGYHFYPARALAWLLLTLVAAAAAASLAASRARWTERLFAAIAGAAAITVAAAAVAGALAQAADPLDSRYDADPSVGQLIPFVREHAAGEPVMVLSPNMASGFPLTTYAGTEWPERYSNLWPLVAAYDSAIRDPAPLEFRPHDEATPIEERLRRTVAEDLARTDPALVLVLATGPDEPRWGMRRLDLLGFLTGDPAFAAAFARYDSAGVVGQYVVYGREGEPIRIPPRAPGSAAVDAPDEVVLDPAGLAAGVLFIVVLIALYRRAGERGPIAAPQPEPS